MSEIGRLLGRKGTLMPSGPVVCLLSGHALHDRALVCPELLLMPLLDSADYAEILNVASKSMIPHQKEGRPPPPARSSSTSSPHCIREGGAGSEEVPIILYREQEPGVLVRARVTQSQGPML